MSPWDDSPVYSSEIISREEELIPGTGTELINSSEQPAEREFLQWQMANKEEEEQPSALI